ncbi:LOW QUALITY PROTEIN: protein spinster homolog 1-like, partial [Aegotheles albertisi]
VTPPLGALGVLLLVTLVTEPPRGLERPPHAPLPRTSWAPTCEPWPPSDATLVLSTLGFTAVAFVTGALALWAPAFLSRVQGCGDQSLVFGVLTCASGVLGVGLGAELSRRLRPHHPRADPLLCGGGLLAASPFLFLALTCARPALPAAYVFIFLGETLLALNWAIVADILLDVVVPTRRATAEALQIVTSHLLGDAGSPYLVGL